MIVEGTSLDRDLELRCDALVIGSGCGGSVAVRELVRAGKDVVVLEEGGYYTREQYGRFRISESLRFLYRDGGGVPVFGIGDTPNTLLLVGRCVGGGSTVNGGVCFRTPGHVIERWRDELGLKAIDAGELDRAFEDVERTMEVQYVDERLLNEGARRFRAAAEKLGYHGHMIQRNVKDCDACCRCLWGCPHDAKRSTLVTYIEEAEKRGARIYSDCRADRITFKGGRASGS